MGFGIGAKLGIELGSGLGVVGVRLGLGAVGLGYGTAAVVQ